jgi:hypothetical protein
MPLSAGLKSIADSELSDFLAAVTPLQETFIADPPDGVNRYLQLLPTFDALPATAQAPNVSRTPPHRAQGWPWLTGNGYTAPASMRSSLSAHETVEPDGTRGWIVRQRIHQGPESYFRHKVIVGSTVVDEEFAEEDAP